MRLGVYSDHVYHSEHGVLSTNRAFIRFVTSMPPRVDEVVLFGRLHPVPGRAPYTVPDESVRFVPLPFYPRVTAALQMVRAVRESCERFARELDHVDAVWLFGPHPLATLFATIARRKRVPLFLGVRQDYPSYVANRHPGVRGRWAVAAAHVLDAAFRRLARTTPTVVLGAELARRYAGGPILTTGFSLVGRDDLVSPTDALERDWSGDELRLLSVGRLDPEKNPLLLPEILALLRASERRWRLTVAGDGPQREAVASRVRELGLDDAVEFLGEVPNGPELWALYRRSHLFLHVSHTEGLPQVLWEAQAAGLPIVATAVGGVPAAVGDGESALLVPPANARAAADAVATVAADERLRRRLVAAGSARIAGETLEAQLDRIDAFFRSCYPRETERGAEFSVPSPAARPPV